jgi:hypothetical protein
MWKKDIKWMVKYGKWRKGEMEEEEVGKWKDKVRIDEMGKGKVMGEKHKFFKHQLFFFYDIEKHPAESLDPPRIRAMLLIYVLKIRAHRFCWF